MRTFVLVIVAMTCGLLQGMVCDSDDPSTKSRTDAVFKELAAGLPKDGKRAASARLELEYWHENRWAFLNPPVRTAVKTKDGKVADVVLLTAPELSIPGTDFSMAFLLVNNRVVDWASCWSSNRIAKQKLLLEDVDGDGFLDVAFQASDGCWGADKRQQSRPGDKRKWLYAYAITSKGFQSLFPVTEREVKVDSSYDTGHQPVILQVKGLPESLRERELVECTLSLTNDSDSELAIEPGEWFNIETTNGYCFMTFAPPEKHTDLKPGQTVSQVIRLYVEATEKEIAMRLTFVPSTKPKSN